MDTAVVLFTRDLRVRDNPALAAAAREARRVVPLFVLDDRILRTEYGRSPNRLGFLAESLADLDRSLREFGSHHVVRDGDPVEEIAKLAPDAVYCTEDASTHAQRREGLLAERFDLRLHPGTTVVGLDDLKPYKVFTPYYRIVGQSEGTIDVRSAPGRGTTFTIRLPLSLPGPALPERPNAATLID